VTGGNGRKGKGGAEKGNRSRSATLAEEGEDEGEISERHSLEVVRKRGEKEGGPGRRGVVRTDFVSGWEEKEETMAGGQDFLTLGAQ